MLGHEQEEHPKKPTHMSADDLNDGFILPRDDRCPLSYAVCAASGHCGVGRQSPVVCLCQGRGLSPTVLMGSQCRIETPLTPKTPPDLPAAVLAPETSRGSLRI